MYGDTSALLEKRHMVATKISQLVNIVVDGLTKERTISRTMSKGSRFHKQILETNHFLVIPHIYASLYKLLVQA
jgi:hypothetical protein